MNYFEIIKKENIGKSYEMFIDGVSKGVWELKETYMPKEFEFYKDMETLTRIYFSSQIIRMEFEETIDWSKVPVDTKVLVKGDENDCQYLKRYFAEYKDGYIYTWAYGGTSFTTQVKTRWSCGKLYEE